MLNGQVTREFEHAHDLSPGHIEAETVITKIKKKEQKKPSI